MKKIKLIFLLIFFLFMTLTGFAKVETSTSIWTAKPVLVDGKLQNEWTEAKLFHNEDPDVAFTFQNDADNLYIFFAFKDRKTMSTIMKLGMTIWLNPDGKKKKKYGINFVDLQVPAERYVAMLEKRYGPMPEQKKNQFLKMKFVPLNRNFLKGKGIQENAPVMGTPKQKARYKMGWNQQRMPVYEFQIPLARVDKTISGIGCKPGDEITIGFEWGGWNKLMKKQAQNRRRQMMDKYRASGSDSMRLRRDDDRVFEGGITPMKAPKKYNVWHKVKLASK